MALRLQALTAKGYDVVSPQRPGRRDAAKVNSPKGVSSRMLRQERPDLRNRYRKGALWSPSYFAASSGGTPISILKKYIDQQKTPS
jgi:putative transposase